MLNRIKIHNLSNGLTLITEEMSERISASFDIIIRAGSARDMDGLNGTANILSEHIFRGAGQYSNIELNQALDRLGLHYHNSAGIFTSSFSGVLTNNNLEQALALIADIIRKPHLNESEFINSQALALQSIASIEDDPRQKVSILAKETFLNYPLNRPSMGKIEEVQKVVCEDVKSFWQENYIPAEAIISVAGGIDFEQTKDMIEHYFGSWEGTENKTLPEVEFNSKNSHIKNEGSQTHISLAWPSIHISNKDYYKAVLLSNVLSGGMGSRLFTEVREKRGLCYAVGASHVSIDNKGAMMAYVGSSPEKAQEAVTVMVEELLKIGDGISQDELDRARTGLRASLIMQGESSSARARSLANDYYHLKKTRTLEEIENSINSVTLEELIEYAKNNPAGNFSLSSIGPKQVSLQA